MEVSDVAKMKALEDENRRLKARRRRSSAEYRCARDRGFGKLLTPAQKRRAVQAVRSELGISQRRACRYIVVNRRMVRYVRIDKNDGPIRERLCELAAERRRFGFR